jgi:hypothetical protein
MSIHYDQTVPRDDPPQGRGEVRVLLLLHAAAGVSSPYDDDTPAVRLLREHG